MKLKDEEWALLSKFLDDGLELPMEARAAWVASLPGLDSHLRQSLDSLLQAGSGGDTDGLLRTLPKLTHPTPSDDSPDRCGQTLGPYRIIRELGRGGMGAVWLAERSDGLLKRAVALKLPHSLKYGGGGQFLERFHRERDILASLAHPHIASLYDAGIADDGQPYIALEYIAGSTMTAFCDEKCLSVAQRLALFLNVLEAVQHAHTHLVLHRDLKPSNILVTRDGQVKLLDFGIAKLMTDGEAKETELTQAGGRALTLDYASPEQISGQSMTTASDVYSLGVVLYELLAGERPYVLKRDSKGALEDAILTADAVRPSQAAKREIHAKARSTTSKKLSSVLKGDLDTIVLKSLKKLPVERYSTVDAFAQDIQRYLDGEAVLARPESAAYRARKFVMRHKVPVLASMGAVAALAIGLGVALWQASVASREARTSKAVESFLRDVFRANSGEQANPAKARERTARELLDIGAGKIDASLNDAPVAKFTVLDTLARMYLELGLDDEAVKLYRKRVALAKATFGGLARETELALTELAGAMHSSKSSGEEEGVLLEANELMDRRGESSSMERALLLDKLAALYRASDTAKALDYARQATAIYRSRLTSDPKQAPGGLAESLYEEGVLHNQRGEFQISLPLFAEAVSLSRRVGGAAYQLPRLYAYQGQAQEQLMQFAAAEESYKFAFQEARKLNGDQHVDTVQTGMRLGGFLVNTARQEEGLGYLRKARETVIKIRGLDDPFHTPQVLASYGAALARNGRIEEGFESLSQAVAGWRKQHAGTPFLASMLEDQAGVSIDLGRYAEAQNMLDEASSIHGRSMFKTTAERAKLLIGVGKPDEAARLIAKEYGEAGIPVALSIKYLDESRIREEVALANRDASAAIALASQVREQIGRSSERRFLKEYEAAAALVEGRAYLLSRQPDQALTLLTRAIELRSEILDSSSPALGEARAALAEYYAGIGDRRRARSQLAQARSVFGTHKQLGQQYTRPLADLMAKAKQGSPIRNGGLTRQTNQF